MTRSQKHWCFTVNNYTTTEYDVLLILGASAMVDYFVCGKETGTTGTPHLQGYVAFSNRKTLANAKLLICDRAHLEGMRGTSTQASLYCKKDGDYVEYGTLPTGTRRRGDWAALLEHVTSSTSRPTERELMLEFPSLVCQYPEGVRRMLETFHPPTLLVEGDLREWQLDLESRLQADPDDRTVTFVVDPIGGAGKTWFLKRSLTTFVNRIQVLKVGKRDDLAYALDETKSIFMFDVPRTCMEFFQYSIVEMIKDQVVFSPKYQSKTKLFCHKTHVVVFCNECPDMTKLTHDRYDIISLSQIEHNILT